MERDPRSRGVLALAALVFLLIASAGCVPGLRRVSTPDGAFVYGFIAVSESDGQVACVGLTQYENGAPKSLGCASTSPEGLFLSEDLPPTRYLVPAFYVGTAKNSLHDVAKPFTVKPGELHLYGIFKYSKVSDPGIGRAGKFSLTPASKPTHAEVLRKILEQSSLSPKWRKRVQARLKELGG